jgi:DNA mismatch repair protein MutH
VSEGARVRALDHPLWPVPPDDLDELAARARWLSGRSIASLEATLGVASTTPSPRRKGATGRLIEHALGAPMDSHGGPDFARAFVELKTLPLDARGVPRESTFVCRLGLAGAAELEWEGSRVRRKLSHVLFVPIEGVGEGRSVGRPFFFRPTPEQLSAFRDDFLELVGAVALGGLETLSARTGLCLQLRPKAAHSRIRSRMRAEDGAILEVPPRAFYLRASFTGMLLRERVGVTFAAS